MDFRKTYHPPRMLFVDAVIHIKENAHKRNIDLTDSIIATKLNIPEVQFEEYYERNFLPEELFHQFESIFADYYSHLIVTEESYEELEAPLDPLDEENTQER